MICCSSYQDIKSPDELEAENEQIKNSDTLCKLIGEQKIKIAELEAQIEKMKCDVKQEQSYWNSCEMQYDLYQRLLDKWKIKEND